ncbi:MAG: ArsB/NhaD family transporter [Acidobacteria bacterium]|nr:ArsB/NhaD family transporter [Acidobacteriota bacterium]
MYWLATAIFALSYAIIVSEKVHKTKVALMGAALMIGLPILTQHEAFHTEKYGIDYNVVFLLISMMILINIMSKSGIFEWVAIRSVKMADGKPMRIMLLFVVVTAFSSAFLDNVTTVLLIAPVTLLVADELEIDPIPFLIAEAISSNIGGTATLIGDPPNLMVASKAKLTFGDFIIHLTPIVLLMVAAYMFILWFMFRKRLKVTEENRLRVMNMDERRLIRDHSLVKKSLIVMGATIAGFALHGVLHMEPATVALLGAAVLLLISGDDPHHTLAEVEWPTIFFFIGLFIIVGGVVKVGLISDMSAFMIDVTNPSEDSMLFTTMVMLWFSGIGSAIVDNIPFVATMIPLVLDMANTVFHQGALDISNLPAETLHHPTLIPVWWALALGACLGGNGSPIGASANVIVIGIAEKAGKPISFTKFLAYGFPVMLFTLVIATIYVYLRYYL